MRYLQSALIAASVAALVGCGGGTSDESSAPSSREVPAPSRPAARATTPTPASGEPEDLKKQWGPDQMPDRLAQPQEFLYWRVDEMFRQLDKDTDGKLSPEEWTSPPENFQKMDVNGDAFLTKREVIDETTRVMTDSGELH